MRKKFYQTDVAESSSGSIWTSPLFYTESSEEAEFLTMLALQQDWGDGYVPDSFIIAFGSSEDADEPVLAAEPVFPGVEAWNAAGYWNDAFTYSEVTAGMLVVPPIEALAQLGKIECDLPDDVIEAVIAGRVRLSIGEMVDA